MNKKYKLIDFIVITFKNAPICAILGIIDKVIFALIPYMQIYITAAVVNTARNIFKNNVDINKIYLPIIFLLATTVFQIVEEVFSTLITMKLNNILDVKFSLDLIKEQACLKYCYIEDSNTLDLITRVCNKPAEKISKGFLGIVDFFSMLITLCSILCVLIQQVWWAGIIIIVLSGIMMIVSIKSGKSSYDATIIATNHRRVADYLANILVERSNVEEKALFSYVDYVNDEYHKKYEIARKIELKQTVRNFIRMDSISMFTIFITFIIAVSLMPSLNKNAMSVGLYVGIIISVISLVDTISNRLSSITFNIAHGTKYLNDLTEFQSLSSDEEYLALPDRNTKTEIFSEIEFIDVSFKYPGTEKYILNHFSLVIDCSKKYAVVGENGAGKTTFIKLLLGLYDNYEGNIIVDGKNLREYSQSQLKAFFAVVFQDFAKYYLTVKENIELGNVNGTSDEEIMRAIEDMEMSDVVKGLKNGINTNLGKIRKDSVDISGGEWQRFAIARALVSDAGMLILDEPTSALDPIAESKLYEMFARASEGKCVIFISHRLGSVSLADEVVVIRNGCVDANGTHEKLMGTSKFYNEIYNKQRSWYFE